MELPSSFFQSTRVTLSVLEFLSHANDAWELQAFLYGK